MEREIKVSVIVAVYNSEKYLRQCLDSIANQTLREIEIICVNDGSTDGSLGILEEYAGSDSRFRIFTKENEGLGGASARNYGLERARGEYVSILDSDDFFELNMLEEAAAKADALETDIVVFGGYEYDDRNDRPMKVPSILNEAAVPEREPFSYRDCPDKIYQVSAGMAWNKLYRRSFLDKHHVRFQRIKYTDDAYFTFSHMVLAERIAVIRKCFCYYRVNTGASQTDGLSDYPDSAYGPYLAIKKSLVQRGCYDAVKQSFVNCAASFLRYFSDKISRYSSYKFLHEKYRSEIFDALDISGHDAGYFYDRRIYQWICQVIEYPAEELIFKALRAYGGKYTTAILRFQFPCELIPAGSRVLLVGEGDLAHYYYIQMVLSGYCEIVKWVCGGTPPNPYIQNIEASRGCCFDYALISLVRRDLIDEAVSFLRGMGTPDEKIVLGGNPL